MQIKSSTLYMVIAAALSLSLFFSSCGHKKSTDITTPQVENKAAKLDCDLWKSNQTFMSVSYGLALSEKDKIYINKLSIEQLINSIKLESDPELDKVKSQLLDSLDRAPRHNDPLYTIEFTQPAIQLRDRIALGIQAYIEKCSHQ
jgi:hypothetical protein